MTTLFTLSHHLKAVFPIEVTPASITTVLTLSVSQSLYTCVPKSVISPVPEMVSVPSSSKTQVKFSPQVPLFADSASAAVPAISTHISIRKTHFLNIVNCLLYSSG